MIIIEGTTLQVAENNILEVGSTDVQIVTETTDVPVVAEFIQGPEGPSAYTIAKRNGFTGTEEEWLNSTNEAAKQYALNSLEAQKGVAGGFAPLDESNKLPADHLPNEAALKTDIPNLVVKEEGSVISNSVRSINFTGAQLKATADESNNITVNMTSVTLMGLSATSSPGIVAGQNLKINLSGSAYLAGSSITSFTVTPSWAAEQTVTATGNAATVNIVAAGSVGDVLSYTVVAHDNLGNVSLPITKTVNVVTNSAPTGTIVANAPTEVTSASVGNQISFTGLIDNDGTGFTYTIVSSGSPAYTFSKTTGIADGEIVTFDAPNLGTNGSDTNITFSVKGVDSLGAETALKSVTVKTIMSHVVGVVLKATGGGGGTWGQIDIDGNDIATQPTSYFDSNPPWMTTDVTIDGQAMVKVNKFYVKTGVISGGANNGLRAWWISDLPRTGFTAHPAFMKAGAEINQFYIGKYMASTDGAKLQSLSGQPLATSLAGSTFVSRAAARNTGGVTGFQVIDIWQIFAIRWLYLIENRTMASSSPYNYRGIIDIAAAAPGTCLVEGLQTNPTTNAISMFDRNGNRTYGATSPSTFGDIFNPYPVTFLTGAPWDSGFFANTTTNVKASGTAPDANSIVSGGLTFMAISPGMFTVSGNNGTAGGTIGTRLTKV